MIPPPLDSGSDLPLNRSLPGPAALRELARAMSHLTDLQQFTTCLEQTLGCAEFFSNAEIRLSAGVPDVQTFAPGLLTMPLAGATQVHGVLQVVNRAAASRAFGAEDLHLMSALATVIAAALDHAVCHREQHRNLELLTHLLDLAPTGLIALSADGQVALANAAACRWLGVSGPAAVAARLTPTHLGVDWRVEPAFHLRVGGRLIYGEARPSVGDNGHPRAVAFVLVDLTPQQAMLLDGLQRELWRCRSLGLELSFVLLEDRSLAGGMLQRLPELRTQLQPGEMVGPYDVHRVGLVLPGCDEGAALARLRSLAAVLPVTNLLTAVAAAAGTTAVERVVGAALSQMRPVAEVLRPVLLLHEDHPGVNDMLALVLQRRFAIVKSTGYDDTVAHLRARPFAALVTEVDRGEDGGGLELARLARRLQPGIRPIFTTVGYDVPGATADALLSGHLIIRKPFDVARLDAEVSAALAGPEFAPIYPIG